MISLEDSLSQGIPLGEAASYLIRLRGTDKAASAEDVERALSALSAEDRALLLKQANEPMQLPPTGNGQVMKPPSPPPLPATASGTHGMKMAGGKSEDEVGKSRGRAATAAHFERDSHRQSEKNRELGGRLAGAAAGGAAAHFGGKKNPLSTLVGVALGSHLGGKAGKRSGQAADAKKWSKEASALKLAFDELGPAGNPQLQGSAPPFAQGAPPPAQPPRPAGGMPPVNTPPPGAIEPQLDPETQAFLEQEQAADAEAETAHIEMLRQKLQQAQQELQQSQQSSESLQAAQAQHDQTLQQMQAQVSESFQQSAAAADETLKHQQSAAAMRMAFQQLRGKVLELAASDPPTLSPDAQAIMASQAAGPNSAPAPQQGPAGQAPSPGAAPGAAPPAGEEAVNQNAAGTSSDPAGESAPAGETGQKDQPGASGDNKGNDGGKISLKVGAAAFAAVLKEASIKDMLGQMGGKALAALPHAAAGAAIGAGMGAGEAFTSNEPLRQKVQQHEANPNRGLRDTMDLAQAKARLTVGEFGEKHPAAMMGAGALGGALLGAQHGPGVVNAVRESAQPASDIASKIKLLMKGAA